MAGVSMVTVRRAMAEPAGQAIVRREQGRGTFLARRRVSAETTKVGSLRNGLSLDARSSLETRLLGLERRHATAEDAQRLALGDVAIVWEVSRLRLLDGRPMIHEVSVIPMMLAPDLATHFAPSRANPSMPCWRPNTACAKCAKKQTLVSRRATSAELKLLELARQDWVVEIAGVSYSARQIPIDSFRMVFDAKAFAFRMETAPTSMMEAVALRS